MLRVRVLVVVVALCGIASAFFPLLSIPAGLALLITGLMAGGSHQGVLALVACGALGSCVGLVRFVIEEAAPGVVQAGQNAQARSALYKLRELRLAQDGLRKTAAWDPDGDGVGSAGTLGELVGLRPLREVKALEFPLLPLKWSQQVRVGDVDVACLEGYCFAVHVPDDDELAERRYTAYAWPASNDVVAAPPGPSSAGDPTDVLRGQVLFLDEHERIYGSDNAAGYVGTAKIPSFDAALPPPPPGQSAWRMTPRGFQRDDDGDHGHVGGDGDRWRPWRGKQSLASLPGDR